MASMAYRGFDGAGLDGRKPVRKAEINGEEGVYIGSQGYVPRLVQVDVPYHRTPLQGGANRLSQKPPTKSWLKTLGDECYAPSGVMLRPDDLVDPKYKTLPAGRTGEPCVYDGTRDQRHAAPSSLFDGLCPEKLLQGAKSTTGKP
ncbi:unnamed protein product [Cladocopium goreaui]|uniref:Ankyrin-3 n=1 Tax=Cladocopium goreaui TaxID=2562237 RepID=A0A9P1DHW9_9DINO|nr:unnamed protein product [Cladocopium goreaui]|mmetsp:Transcript_35914/g.73379  ORF Transcript_35914/g.73379 Transcript_35914/m.73379 type:complete len:145 (+) Transcript_35914:55-489(+)